MTSDMTSHGEPQVGDGALLALLDGELSPAERRRVEARIAACAASAARRDELRFAARRVTAALEVIDVPAEWGDVPEALREAARSAPAPLGSARASRIGWMGRRSVAVAAGLTLLLAAGAYAVPGSPVRDWVDGGIEAIAAWIAGDADAPAQAGPSRVSVEPDGEDGGSVRVTVASGGASVRITVRLTDDAAASVVAGDANFHVEPGVIEVAGAAGEVVVTLPRGARSGSVRVDDTEVVRLEGGELVRTESADEHPAQIRLGTDG